MATSVYFTHGARGEQNLYEDLVIEALKIYGKNVYYLPRTIVNKDKIFFDDIPSKFNSTYVIEMYIDNVDGYGGEGDIFTKFGIELREQATFTVAKRRWKQAVGRMDNEISGDRPREGDLLYFPMGNVFFEIMKVDPENPFFQLQNLPTFKMFCEKFEFSEETFDTGIDQIDNLVQLGYQVELRLADSDTGSFVIGHSVSQAKPGGVVVTGTISEMGSDNSIYVSHSDFGDSGFHQFGTGLTITSTDDDGRSIRRLVVAVDEHLADPGAQNKDFRVVADPFIDFSESNPFGSISEDD